jgi:uncharacterized membrane protein
MSVSDDRLTEIEARLGRIEAALGLRSAAAPAPAAPPSVSAQAPKPPPRRRDRFEPREPRRPAIGATQLMAWAASFAFILAATYFVKLVYDAGWLTPDRQIGLASLAGLALIGAGLALGALDRAYAAYLPAVGVVILYLALYAGHIQYDLFDPQYTYAQVVAITLAAIWLGRHFEAGVYALLAVLGSYLAPILIDAPRVELSDVVVYFTSWSILFSLIAVLEKRRLTYLLALYSALLGFDWVFRATSGAEWATAAVYQFAQFLVFAAAAVWFSVRHRQPMTAVDALAHGIALFYFYGLEYVLLREHLPFWTPILALASVLVVLAAYVVARAALRGRGDLEAGAVLASSYCAIVTAHVVFFDLLPEEWTPWLALVLPVVTALLAQRIQSRAVLAPVAIVSAAMFALGFLRLLSDEARYEVPLPSLALCLYAASLYAGYWLARRRRETHSPAPLLLYAGHLATLTATVRIFESGLAVSIAWAVLAIALLLYALWREERVVGQSSLVVFAASGLKVMFHDLSGSATLVRVLTLVVLAVSLYAGGWLYQQMSSGDRRYHPDKEVNDQLNLLRRLVERGLGDADLASELTRRGIPYLGRDGTWSAEIVRKLRADYRLG